MLGLVFVLLVCFLRQGIIGGMRDLYGARSRGASAPRPPPEAPAAARGRSSAARARVRRRATPVPHAHTGPILQASGLTKRYGGIVANATSTSRVERGELRGIIGPNGAGKTHASSRC